MACVLAPVVTPKLTKPLNLLVQVDFSSVVRLAVPCPVLISSQRLRQYGRAVSRWPQPALYMAAASTLRGRRQHSWPPPALQRLFSLSFS